MKRFNFIKNLLIPVMVLCGSSQMALAGTISDLDDPEKIRAFFDDLIVSSMEENHSTSGVISLVKDGKVIFQKGYGHQNLETKNPVDPTQTLFQVASVSKLFTWVAVMQLVEQGKIDLDTDINQYLTTFQIDDTFPGQPITMRHIMTHTAGFEDGTIGVFFTKSVDDIIPLAEAAERYQQGRINPPGTHSAYSNYGSTVAGLIVEQVSGTEFKAYIQKHIFDPLGMKKSSFESPLPKKMGDQLANTYAWEEEEYVWKPIPIYTNLTPAGAVSATASDMTKFLQALLNGGAYEGGRILKEKTLTEMLTRNFSHDSRLPGMALGFYESFKNGNRLVEHGGDLEFTHTNFILDQKNNIGMYMTFNGVGGRMVRSPIEPGFYDEFFPVEKETLIPPTDFSERAEKYTGTYNFWRSNFSKLEKISGMTSGMVVEATDNNTLMVPYWDEVVEIDKNLFQQVDGDRQIAFQENEQGEITGFVHDAMPFLSSFRTPFYFSGTFNFLMLGLVGLMYIGVILRNILRSVVGRFIKRISLRSLSPSEKKVLRISLLTVVANLLAIGLGVVVTTVYAEGLVTTEIPVQITLWLWLPMLAFLLGVYHLYCARQVWKHGLLGGILARVGYSAAAAGSLFICWFYYFWNILGFQYFS